MLAITKGKNAEDKASAWLKDQGLKLIVANYRCRMGEIDLIMKDAACYVFVEVRQRTSSQFGGGVGSISLAKKQKIIKTATHYLLSCGLYDKCPVRFDVISIDGAMEDITWIRDAFGLDY